MWSSRPRLIRFARPFTSHCILVIILIMMKVSLFAELSSDNFIAGINGNLDGFREAHKLLPEGEFVT